MTDEPQVSQTGGAAETVGVIPVAGLAVPRGLVIGLGLAAGVLVAAGIHAMPDILGPVFLALVLIITVEPLRGLMMRSGAPRWLATLVVMLGVFGIIAGLVAACVVALAQFAHIVPEYADQLQVQLAGPKSWLAGLGMSPADIRQVFTHLDPANILGFVDDILGGLVGVFTSVLFIATLLIFLAVDGGTFGERMHKVRPGHEPVLAGLGSFAAGTRRYFAVATIFGGIVAVLDGLALLIIGLPGTFLWALLAFVTNYIPNIGFVIGLLPPAIIALLDGGPGQMILVIVIYCVLNVVIQSVLQPKFVGDAVGLTTTTSFLSLIVWTYLLGPLGAILAIPATLLIKAVLVDNDPDARWLQLFLGDEPTPKNGTPPAPARTRSHSQAMPAPTAREST